MDKNWDYANLAHDAKEAGGPEKYLQIIKNNSYKEGRKEQLIIDALVALGVGCVVVGCKTWGLIKSKIATAVQEQEIEQALVKEIKEEMDKENLGYES